MEQSKKKIVCVRVETSTRNREGGTARERERINDKERDYLKRVEGKIKRK